MRQYPNIAVAIAAANDEMRRYSKPIHTAQWQGLDISQRPEAEMREVMYFSCQAPIIHEDLDEHRRQIQPNLPWADDHFIERVAGEPLNPGEQWAHWPWAHSANRHRTEGEQFNHTYMERFWPKFAGQTEGGKINIQAINPNRGIRHTLGDLGDLVEMLAKDPTTRQAYLPIYFPEDTGLNGRKPCTLGYLFYMRDGKLDVTYYIRSCDFFRHFRDDIYLTVRLLLWVLDNCKVMNPEAWADVTPGLFRMDIGSLHCFINDYNALFGQKGK